MCITRDCAEKSRDVDVRTRGVEVGTRDAYVGIRDVDVGTRDVDGGTRDVDVRTRNPNVGTGYVPTEKRRSRPRCPSGTGNSTCQTATKRKGRHEHCAPPRCRPPCQHTSPGLRHAVRGRPRPGTGHHSC